MESSPSFLRRSSDTFFAEAAGPTEAKRAPAASANVCCTLEPGAGSRAFRDKRAAVLHWSRTRECTSRTCSDGRPLNAHSSSHRARQVLFSALPKYALARNASIRNGRRRTWRRCAASRFRWAIGGCESLPLVLLFKCQITERTRPSLVVAPSLMPDLRTVLFAPQIHLLRSGLVTMAMIAKRSSALGALCRSTIQAAAAGTQARGFATLRSGFGSRPAEKSRWGQVLAAQRTCHTPA